MSHTNSIAAPPGLPPNFVAFATGGTGEWTSIAETRQYTNAFIIQEGKILLGYKKRGFGLGKYNGFGGKVDPGETPAEAAVRELQEEAGISAPLEHTGTLVFLLDTVPWTFHIDVYSAREFTGEPIETDEMRPEWFALPSDIAGAAFVSDLPQIPYETMWADDVYWMRHLLQGIPFVGRCDFEKDGLEGEGSKIVRWWFGAPRHT
ncbi:hypothetical protein CONPUDRAFT_168093 [Coniophora puteana RWD-64-598 SS2]|uniref:Oxidized purine nucleoside triphosphate hydrolase n=1 Tax=Coniophora puteana (strain RWD-64-598) TaxID=741705 RepID=A0A5M3MER0_CONPW|nr:uncharacterized protein CONPUDRAFT_168093 [Coniophora puteana RWD-64-598 SS2]EIW77071.1 hypothetical protein CONPUDRAFT_168093 [Coniophora puteana RWD-64-598 SS2]